MKSFFTILLSVFVSASASSQVVFRTVVPQHPVTVGESFQVQYVVEEGEDISNFMAPIFAQFRLVTGPNVYQGTAITLGRAREVRNMVYTLEATKTGRFTIPGAAATVNGKLMRSPDQKIIVITEAEALQRFERENNINADYFLRPGEDPIAKINRNLFLKVMVDRKSCYTGEPVVATFKLYSRLESKSDIVKNPGFYGFTVHDVVNLSDRLVTTEDIDGRTFDVHTIRKVELFPLQAGKYTIDPMEISNVVEFSRSAVHKKTEQEIVEGVNIEPLSNKRENTLVYETDMRTEPVTIDVRPLPATGRPEGYDGAVGKFSLRVSLPDSTIAKNQEGFLELHVMGSGNMIQVNAPSITWPKGIEGFEPVVVSQGGNSSSASKVFRYAFVSAQPGEYDIPSIDFSFFNPDSGRYSTTRTGMIHVKVTKEDFTKKELAVSDPGVLASKKGWWGILVFFFIAIAGITTAYFFFKKKEKQKLTTLAQAGPAPVDIDQLLAPAFLLADKNDASFFIALRKGIYEFFHLEDGMAGSDMRKDIVAEKMKLKGAATSAITDMNTILEQCETGMFTRVTMGVDRKLMAEKAKEMLTSLRDHSL